MKNVSDNEKSTLLWYSSPASEWNSALPVGNGRLGGMIFGDPSNDLIQLNEDSLWSGGFRDRNNPLAKDNLEKMRRLIREGETKEAERLCEYAFYGLNENQRHYQPLGDFHIFADFAECLDYKRSLDISTAVSETEYTSNGVHYKREVFVSAPDQVMVIHFTADKKGSISFVAGLDGRDDNYDKNEAYDDDTLIFTVSDGIPYAAAITGTGYGGMLSTNANRIAAYDCDEAYVFIACNSAYRTADYENLSISQVKKAARHPEKLLERHIRDYKSYFERSSLELSDNSGGTSAEPTNVRLEKFRNGGNDNKLIEMYFNFSKYLMISGSRPGTLPLNLQGIWNKDMWPAWGGKYTVNINTEMNYWAAEMQNLSDCTAPLYDHIERMREHGRVTARKMYGCRGSVCHHNTDIWGDTAPQDKWLPGTLWPMGLAWLCIHIWEHYLYTRDKDFLEEKYDTMAEAAEFFIDYLTEDEKGRMVTSPSVSPENTYITSAGAHGTICRGPSMDSQILYTLFSDIISAASELGLDGEKDKEFIGKIKELRAKLPEPQIGKYGQIMEWSEDYDEAEPGHRHISQMFALYPSDIITPWTTPELAAAARATIERRLAHGGGHTGWSRAWIINMWARLGDSEKVEENIRALIGHSTSDSMLDMHPPFQIDGNFGGGAGIGEAILQSHGGRITLLPACPWESGRISHFRARGGYDVSFAWENGKITELEIISDKGTDGRPAGRPAVYDAAGSLQSITRFTVK